MKNAVSILIPFHSNKTQPYLDLCLESIQRQQGIEYEVIVFSGAPQPPTVPDWVKMYHEDKVSSYAYKINRAFEKSNQDYKYVLIAQDDLVLGKDCLKNLAEMVADGKVLLNPLSNCDNTHLYLCQFQIKDKILPRFFRMDFIEDIKEDLFNYNPGLFMAFPVNYLCTYCTMLLREAFVELEGMDERYVNGCEDVDFCMKAKSKGMARFVTTNAFVLHFAGVTSTGAITSDMNNNNYTLLEKKWGIRRSNMNVY
mgnify:CR=1 FL=1